MNNWEDISNKDWRRGFSDGIAVVVISILILILVITIVVIVTLA